MAESHFIGLLVPEVQTIPFAMAEEFAILADTRLGPGAIPHDLVPVFPHVGEVVLVDVPLDKTVPQVGACGDASVHEYGAHIDSSTAEKEVVSDTALIVPQEALASVVGFYLALLAGLFNEVEYSFEFIVGQLQLRILRSSSDGENRRDPPSPHTEVDQQLSDLRQLVEVAVVDAGQHIVFEVRMRQHLDRIDGSVEGEWVLAQPVVRVTQSVQAYRAGTHPRLKQGLHPFLCHQISIGDDTPREPELVELPSGLLQILAHQGLPARDHNDGVMGVDNRDDLFDRPDEVLDGHVLDLRGLAAITATMQAAQRTAQRAFPEKIGELMAFRLTVSVNIEKL